MKKQLSVFGTRSDLEPVLVAIESKTPVHVVRAGLFDSPRFETLQSLLEIPGLGAVEHGDTSRGTKYLVAGRQRSFRVRTVPQRSGAAKYAIDQLENPESVSFQPGGIYEEGCLVAGSVGTASESGTSLGLVKLFADEFGRKFTQIKSHYIGQQALALLDAGWRLTWNTRSPSQYDLTR